MKRAFFTLLLITTSTIKIFAQYQITNALQFGVMFNNVKVGSTGRGMPEDAYSTRPLTITQEFLWKKEAKGGGYIFDDLTFAPVFIPAFIKRDHQLEFQAHPAKNTSRVGAQVRLFQFGAAAPVANFKRSALLFGGQTQIEYSGLEYSDEFDMSVGHTQLGSSSYVKKARMWAGLGLHYIHFINHQMCARGSVFYNYSISMSHGSNFNPELGLYYSLDKKDKLHIFLNAGIESKKFKGVDQDLLSNPNYSFIKYTYDPVKVSNTYLRIGVALGDIQLK